MGLAELSPRVMTVSMLLLGASNCCRRWAWTWAIDKEEDTLVAPSEQYARLVTFWKVSIEEDGDTGRDSGQT